ncbi:MAG: hypothetical protein Q8O68_00370 [Candidatus Daviesbacteria bacterium]|nr:hypothetical protein [Candidatus Daviesbacteria bacterium]
MKIKNADFTLISFILLGFLIRLSLIFLPGFKIDVDTWFGWAIRLNQVGFVNFYSDQIWTNYTPGYLYILYALGWIKNLLSLDNQSFYLILKLPAILAEVFLGFIIYKLIAKKSLFWAKIALGLLILNPAVIFNSSVWGQIEGLLTLSLIISVIFLYQQKLILSSIFFAISLLIKPQAVLLIPVFIFYFFSNFSLRNILKFMAVSIATIFIFSFPFFVNNPLFGPINLFSKMISDYSYTSAFAYNLWGVIGFWITDSQEFINVTYRNLGFILVLIYWIIIGYFYYRKKISFFILATLAALSFYFLPTRVHDRYLYPALIFLIISVTLFRSYLLLGLSIILSLVHFLNLYYVYVYYNEFYLNLPKILYNPYLFGILDTNARIFSLISVIIFFSVTTIIIKSDVKSKKV